MYYYTAGEVSDEAIPRPGQSPCVIVNCTNDICRENGLDCCGNCEKLDYAQVQVCQCCPQV